MNLAGNLAGRVAVITGGSTGIGLEAAKLFIAEGAFVYIMCRCQNELDAAVALLGAAARGVQGDVACGADRARLFQAIESDGRRLDVLFANAGTVIGSISEGQFDHIAGANFMVVYAATKAALRSLVCTCAAGLRNRKIRVNLLSPGTTDTAIIAAMPPEFKQALAAAALARRLADPIEIAQVALFIAAEESNYVNGSELFAEGGAARV